MEVETMEDVLVWVRAVLTSTPARWRSLAETLPAELVSQPPAPGEWSALECLQHLVDTERWVFRVRVQALLAGQDFPAFDPDRQGTKPGAGQSAAALSSEFARLRADSLALLAQVGPADLGRKARHQELGPVTLGELVHEWAAHDLMHTVQAERAVMQPFIRRCGPWQPYFVDHVVGGKLPKEG
jgi:hypothetical protein